MLKNNRTERIAAISARTIEQRNCRKPPRESVSPFCHESAHPLSVLLSTASAFLPFAALAVDFAGHDLHFPPAVALGQAGYVVAAADRQSFSGDGSARCCLAENLADGCFASAGLDYSRSLAGWQCCFAAAQVGSDYLLLACYRRCSAARRCCRHYLESLADGRCASAGLDCRR